MPKLFKLFGILLVTASCATIKVPNHKVYITLPASGDGYWIETITHKEGRIPKDEWDEKLKRGVVLMSEDWAAIKKAFSDNCIKSRECAQVTGALDSLFDTIDESLGTVVNKLPKK